MNHNCAVGRGTLPRKTALLGSLSDNAYRPASHQVTVPVYAAQPG